MKRCSRIKILSLFLSVMVLVCSLYTGTVFATGENILSLTESWQLANNYSPESDPNVSVNYKVLDKGYNPEMSTQATLSFEEPMDLAVSSKFSLKITSPIDEGYCVHSGDYRTTHPYLSLSNQWVPSANAKAILIQVKLPKEKESGQGSQIRVNFTDHTGSFVLTQGLKYHLLGKNYEEWTEHTYSEFNDNMAYLTLPNGFEGYIAFEVPSAYHSNSQFQVVGVELRLGTVGPTYGDFYFGGIYSTTDFNKGLKATSTTRVAAQSLILRDCMELTESWQLANNNSPESDPNISGNYKVLDKGYNPEMSTQATLSFEEPMDLAVSSKFSLKISSPVDEGYAVHNGDYKTTHPYLSLNNQWVPAQGAEAVLLQLKLPLEVNAGEGSLIRVNLTDSNYTAVLSQGTKYYLLEKHSGRWTEHTVSEFNDGVAYLSLPNGFEGYLAFDLPDNYLADSSVQIVGLELRLGALGPTYGDFYFGGIYCVADFNGATKAVSTTVNEPVDMSVLYTSGEWNSLEATTVFAEEKDSAQTVSAEIQYLDKGYGEATQGKISYAVALENSVAAKNSVKLSSDIAEGYALGTTFPYIAFGSPVDLTYGKQLMLHIKMPELTELESETNFRLTMLSYTLNGETKSTGEDWKDIPYKYLDKESNEWVEGTTGGYGTTYLPLEFEGYILYDLSSLTDGASVEEFTVNSFEIRPGAFGKGHGDFCFGGVYSVYEFKSSLLGKVNSADAVYMMDESYIDGPVTEEGEWNFLEVEKTFKHEKDSEQKISSAIQYLDKGYGEATQGKISYTDALGNSVAAKNAVKLTSDIAEGYALKTTFPFIKYESKMDLTDSQLLMLHIKMPDVVDDQSLSNFRFTMLSYTLNGETKNSGEDWYGVPFKYLTSDGNEWIDGTTGGYGTTNLPLGFEGYILYDLSSLADGVEVEEFVVNYFEIRPGAFGKDYGDFYFGGVYKVLDFKSSLFGKVFGQNAISMTGYRENDIAGMNAVRENIDAMGEEIDFYDLVYAETARSIYDSLVPNDQARIEKEYLEKLKSAEKELAIFKPNALGYKVKADGKQSPELKIGFEMTVNIPDTFEVYEFGILTAKTSTLRKKSLDCELATAEKTVIDVKSENKINGETILEFNELDDYKSNYSARSYVIYRNKTDNTTFTVYNNNIVDGDKISETVSASLLDIANAAGIAIYAKR